MGRRNKIGFAVREMLDLSPCFWRVGCEMGRWVGYCRGAVGRKVGYCRRDWEKRDDHVIRIDFDFQLTPIIQSHTCMCKDESRKYSPATDQA